MLNWEGGLIGDTNTYAFQPHEGSAVHEAGHAVISVLLGRELKRITILRDECGDGLTDHEPITSTPKHILEEIAITLAGGAAADLWNLITNCDDDNARAVHELKSLFPDASPEYIATLMEKIRACLERAASQLKTTIALLANRLLKCKDITGPAAESIIASSLGKSVPLAGCLASIRL